MTCARFFWCVVPVLLALAIVGIAPGQDQTSATDTSFTYEGRLIFGGEPVSGSADFRFLLFDDPAGGERHGPVLEWPDGALHRGWFEVELDFGVDLHDGTPRWLEVQVRAPAGEGDFEPLRPRQAVLPMLAARQSILNLDGEPRVFGEDANEPRTGAGAGADPADPRFADTLPGGFGDDPIGPPPGGGRPDGVRGAHPAGGGGPRQSLWVMTGQHIRNANSGNVGVGATSVNPRHRLHVITGGHGHAAIHAWSGGTGNTIGIRGSVNSPGGVGVRGQNFATSGLAWGVHGITNSSQGRAIEGRSNHSSGYAGYFVGGRNYFEGNVGIGTTSPSQNSMLDVQGGRVEIRSGSDGQDALVLHSANGNRSTFIDTKNTGEFVIEADNQIVLSPPGPTAVLAYSVQNGQWVTMRAQNFETMSTRTIKENISHLDIPRASAWLERISSLRPATYTFVWDDGDTPSQRLGFIAEELPSELLSDDGSAVDVYAMTSAAVVAIQAMHRRMQEQDRLIEEKMNEMSDLRQRIEDLESRFAEMEKQLQGSNQ